jgi:predicted DCC family thiol-disulfide oxidoreductase YuxK
MTDTQKHSAIILFDGVCNFCNSSINFVIRHDKKNHFRFAPLQSETGKQLLQQFEAGELPLDSIVLIENNKLYKQSTAVLKIAKQLGGAYRLLYGFVILPSFLRDAVYKYVAKNRYKWFGKKDSCMIPTKEIREKFIS